MKHGGCVSWGSWYCALVVKIVSCLHSWKCMCRTNSLFAQKHSQTVLAHLREYGQAFSMYVLLHYIDWPGVFNRVERSLALLQCMYVFVNPTVVFIFCSHVKLCVAGYLAFSMCGHIWRHADVQSWDCQQWVEDNRWRISWILALCICPHCEYVTFNIWTLWHLFPYKVTPWREFCIKQNSGLSWCTM